MMKAKSMIFVCSLVAGGLLAGDALAQQFIYPKNNQTPDQQKKDEFDCHNWAVQQTGFDPIAASQQGAAAPLPTGPAQAESGSGLRGAAKGAAAGAAIGAIAGDAGKGAAIGAAAGGIGGRTRSKNRAQDAQSQQIAQANAAAANQAKLAERYNAARTACLEGKGYTVK
jgi:OmpA family protein